ncbi:MAG: DUF4349 domain-containing protein [Microthrixaceae bacterium]
MGDRPENDGSTTPGCRRRWIRTTATTPLVVAAVAALLTAGGCSGFGGSDNAASSDDSATREARSTELGPVPDAALDEEAAGGATLLDTASVESTAPAVGRDQVFTATLDIEVEVLEESVSEASTALEALGGFAANEDIDLGESRRATVAYRVPADQFDQAMNALAAVGDLQTQQVEAQDVTSQYADLEGRVTTLRTSIGRLQGFLAEATDANQIASLEGELTRREAELESTEAQRRALADRIELSTITVSFTGSEPLAPVDDTRTLPTFLGGLETGWDILVAVGAFTLSALGLVAPFLPLVLLVVLLGRWARRRGQDAELAESA